MSDATQSNVATPDSGFIPSSGSGIVPFFKKSGRPSPFSMADINRLVKALRALQQMQVQITDAEPNQDGSYTPSGKITLSDTNAILELFIAPTDGTNDNGSANIIPMQVQSYTTTNQYLSAENGSFNGSGVWTSTGSAVNVALPWELRPAQSPAATNKPFAIWQPYTAGDIISVVNTDPGENGVFISGVELSLMDLGIGRCWALPVVEITYDNSSCATKNRYIQAGSEF